MKRTHSGTLPLVMALVMTTIMIVLYLMEQRGAAPFNMLEVGSLAPSFAFWSLKLDCSADD